MLLSKWDSYFYSRPISYRSYYPRQQKVELLKKNDVDTQQVLNLLGQQKDLKVIDLGGLGRGIRFDDLEVGRRVYGWNNQRAPTEWFIHQWKPTDDRAKWHPVGTHLVFTNFSDFLAKLNEIFVERNKKY